MNPRPNFLFLITDQHRPDHTGFGGNPIVRTPNLDGLAARGLRFDRALVANPICMPNRSSIMTGRMPSVHGTRYNGIALDWGANTFMRSLRASGWHTAHIGKCHLQNMGMGRGIRDFVWRSSAPEDASREAWPAGWDEWENDARHKREKVALPADFYGLDEVDLTVDHSDYCGGHYYQWLLEQGVDPEKLQGRGNALPYEAKWDQVWKTRVPEALYPTSYVTRRTVELIERRARTPEKPWFAFGSYPDPHHPFTPPGRYFEMYDPAKIPLPETFADPHTESSAHFRQMIALRGKQAATMAPFAPTAEQYREMAAAEYGMITMIDDGIGEILAALERTGQAENTIVIFTSDHGDMFGDHGVMLKAGMHYEGCIRVPLVIAGPGITPGVTRALASSLDLAQTMLELAGLPVFHGMQGTSLAPLLRDPGARARDHVLVEEDEMFDLLGIGRPLRMRTLVSEEARLTLYEGVEHAELFDLQADPRELTNLWSQPGSRALRTEMTERLARHLMDYADSSPKPKYMA
jgi:arylsulfatase A-like enzyme